MKRLIKYFSEVNAAIATAFADVGDEVECNGHYTDLVLEITNTGTNLSDLSLMVKMHPDGSFVNLVTGAGWATTTPCVKAVTASLNTLATGSVGIAHIELGPVFAFKVQAKVASSTTSVTAKGIVK